MAQGRLHVNAASGNRHRQSTVAESALSEKVRLQHRAEYAAFRAALAGVRLLGRRGGEAMARAAGRAGFALGIRRDIVESNIRAAFPEATDAWVADVARESYEHLGRETMTMLRLSWMSRAQLLERTRLLGEEALRAACDAGRGVVIVTGHLGNWEIGAGAGAVRGFPISAVAKRAANPLFYERIMTARQRLGFEIIDFADATRGALRALRQGRVVALAADQHSGAGVWVPFLGRLAATFRGPAVMALRTGAPLFLAVSVRRPDAVYEVALERIDTTPTADMEGDVLRVTRSWVGRLESAVRAHPGQYLWHHRRWRTPPASPGQEPEPASAV
jgi:Kdo2-lipid IVA lauroyltransferase/acyltransferase